MKTLTVTLSFMLPPGVNLQQVEVSKMFEPKKKNSEAEELIYPVLKVNEKDYEIVGEIAQDGHTIWPAEDYFEGDNIYDELYPRN